MCAWEEVIPGERRQRERRLFSSPKPVADPPDARRGPGDDPAPPNWVVTDRGGRTGEWAGGDSGRGEVAARRGQRKMRSGRLGGFSTLDRARLHWPPLREQPPDVALRFAAQPFVLYPPSSRC